MLEKDVEQEVQFYRQTILQVMADAQPRFHWSTDAPEVVTRLKALAQKDPMLYRTACFQLLQGENQVIRSNIIDLMRFTKKRDPMLAAYLAQMALEQKDIADSAISAIWSMKTRAVLPQIFLLAEQGNAIALDILRHLVRTPEDIERGIVLARRYIGAEEYSLRESALFFLQRHSTMELEAERILPVVQIYTDELFIDALEDAPVERVLEPLKSLQDAFAAKYKNWSDSAESHDLSVAISVLEQRKQKKGYEKKYRFWLAHGEDQLVDGDEDEGILEDRISAEYR